MTSLIGRDGSVRRRCIAALGAFFVAALAARSSHADQPTPSDAAAAEALFDEGRRLLAAGDVKAACPKFAESHRLDPALGALLNLATCHEREGKSATAWSEFRQAESEAMALGDDARRKLAADHAARLEPELARITVVAKNKIDGLVVRRDGVPLGEASFGAALPIDPGVHVLSATAPGYKPWTTRFEAEARKLTRVEVPSLERAPVPEIARVSRASSGRSTAGLVIGGAGVVVLVVGGVFVGLTAAKKAEADDRCPDKACDIEGADMIDTARAYAWVADIGIAAGTVGVVAGGLLLLTSGGPAQPAAATVTGLHVVPTLDSHGGKMDARFTF
jgi:hypothetical protein